MTDRHHAPEHQVRMPVPKSRPACHTTEWPVSVRAPRFWDQGRACGNSASPALWAIAIHHTPTCMRCTRALRGLLLDGGETLVTLVSSAIDAADRADHRAVTSEHCFQRVGTDLGILS